MRNTDKRGEGTLIAMLAALLLGISYGFAAGSSPGPLLGLVITQTLKRGWRVGNLIALAPLLSDLPIVLLAVLLISRLPHAAFGWLGIIGGLFVVYLGIETMYSIWKQRNKRPAELQSDNNEQTSTSAILVRAALTNALNPHPYLFWGTVGAQLLIRITQQSGIGGAVVFLTSFYALLVGSKLAIAFIVSRSRHWLQGKTYQVILVASGVLLMGLGVLLITEGIQTLQ